MKAEGENIMKNLQNKTWKIEGDIAVLTYDDGDIVTVKKTDFDRAFGAIINATKEEVIRDFAI